MLVGRLPPEPFDELALKPAEQNPVSVTNVKNRRKKVSLYEISKLAELH